MGIIEVLMHPVRMKIALTLMSKQNEGMTTLELASKLKDVSQATLYRHIQFMEKSNIIYIKRKEKVHAVTENYYSLNEDAIKIDRKDWHNAKREEKIDFISYYQLFILHQYQNYLDYVETNTEKSDNSTFSIMSLNLTDEEFKNFQNDIYNLLNKYHNKTPNKNSINRTVALTLIPYSD